MPIITYSACTALQIFCSLMWRAMPATYLHIACSLTAYLKYLQLAYSGAGNLQVFTAITYQCPIDTIGKTYRLHAAHYIY